MLQKSALIAALVSALCLTGPAEALGPQFDSAATRTVPANYSAKNPSLDADPNEGRKKSRSA